MTITVCIPTFRRRELLRGAILSCLSQSHLPTEILVSDDECKGNSAQICDELQQRTQIRIRHIANEGPNGLALNINNAIRNVKSELLLLLHDDDELEPRCIEQLLSPFLSDSSVVASFGMQSVVDADGIAQPKMTEQLNKCYFRTAKFEGLQADSIWSGVMQQFPNDGYLIRSDIAKKVLHNERFVNASEVDFGIRCAEYGKFFFVNHFTAKYRINRQSLSSSGNGNSSYFKARILFAACERYPHLKPAIQERLSEGLPASIVQAVNNGERIEAIRWYFGHLHRKRIFTPGGVRRLVKVICGY